MAYSIRAGVYVEQFRNIKRSRIEAMPSPEAVYIPYSGSVLSVSVGDTVLGGQVIGSSDRANLHASIHGKVVEITSEYIKIENDMTDTAVESKPISKKLGEVSPEEIISVIREAGICDSESLYKTITEAAGKIDKIIINCLEEPPHSVIERLVLEHPASVINGVKILLRLFGVKKAYIVIDESKSEAVSHLSRAIDGSRMISVKKVESKYPLSDDAQLAYLFGERSLYSDDEIFESGAAVFSAEICSAIYRAFASGTPYNYRFISVGGDCIKKHRNLMVPLGTRLSDIIAFCGGLVRSPKYLIKGGALSGESVSSSEFYVTKDTRGILLLSEYADVYLDEEEPCIRCGKCIAHCPMHLVPMNISEYARIGRFDAAKKYGAELCTECGTCSYVCPTARDNLSLIKKAKAQIASENTEIKPGDEVTDGK